MERVAEARPEVDLEERVVRTSGDAFPAKAIESFGKIGVFVRDIDLKVRDGTLDLAVHSLKDVPTEGLPDLGIACYLPRVGGHDVLVANVPLEELPEGARVGTSSARRRALLLRRRADLEVRPIRGNVPTRVAKWEGGEYDALVLSKAGLLRLALDAPCHDLDPEAFIPSPGQGVVAVTARVDTEAYRAATAADDPITRTEAEVERGILRALGGGCLVPLGVRARVEGGAVRVHAELLAPDGSKSVAVARRFPRGDAQTEAEAVANEMRALGGTELLAAVREEG